MKLLRQSNAFICIRKEILSFLIQVNAFDCFKSFTHNIQSTPVMVNPVIVSVWLYSSFNLSLWLRPFDFPNSKIFVDLLIVNHLSMCLQYVSPLFCILIPSSYRKPILTVPRARRNWVGSAYPTLHKFADSYYYHLPWNLRSCPPKTVPFSFLAGVSAVP